MLRQDRNKKSKARELKFLKIWRIFFWSIISIVWYPTNSGTKKFCLRNNFCSVFYVLESKKKLRSYPKIFEKKKSNSVNFQRRNFSKFVGSLWFFVFLFSNTVHSRFKKAWFKKESWFKKDCCCNRFFSA